MIALWLLSCGGGGGERFHSRADPRYPAPPRFADAPQALEVPDDPSDGTLTADGRLVTDEDLDHAGGGDRIVLRFAPAGGADPLVAAHLVLPVIPEPEQGPLRLRIRLLPDPAAPEVASEAAVDWDVPAGWADPYDAAIEREERSPPACAPFWRRTPDLTPLLAELGAGWSSRPLGFVIEAVEGELRIQDSAEVALRECRGRVASRLELARTVRATLAGKELLSRPTDRSITLSIHPRVPLEVQVEWWSDASPPPAERPDGSAPDALGSVPAGSARDGSVLARSAPDGSARSGSAPSGSAPSGSAPSESDPSESAPSESAPSESAPSGSALDPALDPAVRGRLTRTLAADITAVFELRGLAPDTAYTLRLRYRLPGAAAFEVGPERTFRTRRAPGQPFTFTVSADVHLLNMEHRRTYASMHLLKSTMERIGRDRPDFHLDLGDSFNGESYRSFDATDPEEMQRRLLSARAYFEQVQAPVFSVLGNHEGEQGWRIAAGDPLPDVSVRFRRLLFPNPVPGDSVSGNPRVQVKEGGFTENYYAFRWGDVLFVVLDPYRYTETKPHQTVKNVSTNARWHWTLGQEQYDWLVRTLEASDAPFELVLSHQVTGGTNNYGRGGRLAAMDFEWGAPPEVLAEHRPGWTRSVHRVLADAGVTAFLHGHDHVFAFESPLDGVAYVTVPQPGDAQYDKGHGSRAEIDKESATIIENAGYLRFRAAPGSLAMEYVRTFLPGDGEDGQVAFRYEFTDCDANGISDLVDVARGRPDTDQDGKPDACR